VKETIDWKESNKIMTVKRERVKRECAERVERGRVEKEDYRCEEQMHMSTTLENPKIPTNKERN